MDQDTNFFDAYAAWTDKVAKYPPTAEPYYLALGIADELGELATANDRTDVLKEAGDVLWYCSRYSVRVLKINLSLMIEAMRLTVRTPGDRDVMTCVGTIAGFEKKRIRDGEGWTPEVLSKKERDARYALIDIMVWIHTELATAGYTLSDAIVANMGKLTKRLEEGKLQGDGDNR